MTVLAERTTSEWTEDAVFLPLLAAISNVVTNHLNTRQFVKTIPRLGSQAINFIRGKCLNTQQVGALSKWPVRTLRLAFGSVVIRQKDGRARTDLETEL